MRITLDRENGHYYNGIYAPVTWKVRLEKDDFVDKDGNELRPDACSICGKKVGSTAWFFRRGDERYFSCIEHEADGVPDMVDVLGLTRSETLQIVKYIEVIR